MIKIKLGNKLFEVKEALSPKEKQEGLMNVTYLPKDEGMIFYWDEPLLVEMWMRNTKIPLDIIYINEDLEVIDIKKGMPDDDTLLGVENTSYVVELNLDSGVRKGDTLEFIDDSGPIMKVLAQDGSTQMELWGGERIVSRKETKVLIRKALKANKTQSDSDYKSLGKYMFKVLNKQDNRKPEYVQRKD